MIAGFIWMGFIPILKKISASGMLPPNLFWGLLGLGLLYRALFFGSTPIYEDDWNRYLWDGYMVSQGQNPFEYSPNQILTNPYNPEHAVLRAVSDDHDRFLHKINNPDLSTIYPPGAQAAFGLAALIKPLNLDALRIAYLIFEVLTLLLLVRTLPLYGKSRDWALLYAFCPLLIFSGFNAMHMDILLPPFFIAALLFIQRRPFIAGISLAGAAAIKLWPLLLAPALFRNWRQKPRIYISAALLIAGLSALAFFPMIEALGDQSGLKAYASSWKRSSFIFPYLEKLAGIVTDNPGSVARILVAALLAVFALFQGFKSGPNNIDDEPYHLLLIALALLFLSPTGFPWYAIWFIPFLPFMPLYGAALLCALVPLYYLRFALGEQGIYNVYQNQLIPLQFGLPLLVLATELINRAKTS